MELQDWCYIGQVAASFLGEILELAAGLLNKTLGVVEPEAAFWNVALLGSHLFLVFEGVMNESTLEDLPNGFLDLLKVLPDN